MQIIIIGDTELPGSTEHASITVTTQVPNAAGGRDNQIVSNAELLPFTPITLNLPAGQMVAIAVYRADPLPLPVSFPPAQNPTV